MVVCLKGVWSEPGMKNEILLRRFLLIFEEFFVSLGRREAYGCSISLKRVFAESFCGKFLSRIIRGSKFYHGFSYYQYRQIQLCIFILYSYVPELFALFIELLIFFEYHLLFRLLSKISNMTWPSFLGTTTLFDHYNIVVRTSRFFRFRGALILRCSSPVMIPWRCQQHVDPMLHPTAFGKNPALC